MMAVGVQFRGVKLAPLQVAQHQQPSCVARQQRSVLRQAGVVARYFCSRCTPPKRHQHDVVSIPREDASWRSRSAVLATTGQGHQGSVLWAWNLQFSQSWHFAVAVRCSSMEYSRLTPYPGMHVWIRSTQFTLRQVSPTKQLSGGSWPWVYSTRSCQHQFLKLRSYYVDALLVA